MIDWRRPTRSGQFACEFHRGPKDTKFLEAIPVDFNNADADGAVRLETKGTLDFLRSRSIELAEGMTVIIADDELIARALVTMRDGIWVARIEGWLDN